VNWTGLYPIDWRNAWQARRRVRIRPTRVAFDPHFGEHGLSDGFAVARYDDFGYGRGALDVLGDQVAPEMVALEVGPGTGALTFPLARRVARLVAIERSLPAVTFLMEKLAQASLTNVEVRRDDWGELDATPLQGAFDLVICSHFLWQVADPEAHLRKMERASRRLCAVIQPAARTLLVAETWTAVTGRPYDGRFEPDADVFPYLILREWGRRVHVRAFDYTVERVAAQLERYIIGFIAKHVPVDGALRDRIAAHVAPYLHDGRHADSGQAVVLWWHVPEKGDAA
jgi:2-polyprenyl-3-methyl-5-hydroxy-6-metoxy-1,4-benzoquinol methylase